MVKLFWKRMDEVAEGVGVGGGAEHEGGGEGAPHVVVEYSYDEEEIEEDTSRQAQHGDESIKHNAKGAGEHPGGTERTEEHRVALGERVDEQQATGDDGAVKEQEGGAAAQEGGAGVHQQEGGAAAQEGGVGGQGHVVELLQRVTEVKASQKKLVADVFAKHSEQAAVFNKLAGDFWTAWNMILESSKCTLKKCGDALNGVTEERKLLEGACTKLDEMSGKIIEGVAAAITKGIEKVVKEDLFHSTLPPESMEELKDVVREDYQEAEASILEVLTEAMTRGFRGLAGPSTRLRQEEEVAGVRSGVERRFHEHSVPPPSSVGGHVGSPIASPPSRARQTVCKSVEDKEVIVLDQSPLQKTSEAAPKPPPDAFAPL
ncbi:unnamed protein product [Closterium sp. NIES-53]